MARLRLLFICIGNTCRSPMAEAIARSLGRDAVEAHSAGIAPTGRISRHTVSALERMGHSAASLSSKGLHEVPIEEMDVIVSLIGDDGVRFLPGGTSARVESWWIPDPYGEDERVFAAAAREIERRIRTLFDDLLAPELLLD